MKRIEKPEAFEVCKFDGVTATGVYLGSFDRLVLAKDRLKWNVDKRAKREYGETYEILSLAEIYEQLKNHDHLITVIRIGPLSGEVFQCGNYEIGEWWNIGDLDGYA